MTNGPNTFRVVQQPRFIALDVAHRVSPTIRGVRPMGHLSTGEPTDVYFQQPATARLAVTRPGQTPRSFAAAHPAPIPLAGEDTILRILHGTAATGITSEAGRIITGADEQIAHILRLDGCIRELRSAVAQLRDDLPTLEKAANGVAANLHDTYAPSVQHIAQTLADLLNDLYQQLAATDIATVDHIPLAKMFDRYARQGTNLRPASLLLTASAMVFLEMMTRQGCLMRADNHGHGIVFELRSAGDTVHTMDQIFTPAECMTLRNMLGRDALTHRALAITLRNLDSATGTEPPRPFLRVHLDVTQIPAETI